MLKLTFLVYAPHSMLLGDFKTLADWMTALIERMEGKRFVSVSLRDKANLKKGEEFGRLCITQFCG